MQVDTYTYNFVKTKQKKGHNTVHEELFVHRV